MYLRWRRLLPPWIEVLPVELPGRGVRLGEAFVTDFDDLVERLCAEQAGAMQRRFALFGHSMGALIAWGIARRLRQTGGALPCALVVSASAAPSRRDPARFDGLQGDQALIDDLRRQGGTPEEVFASPELLRLTLDVLGADYRLCAGFRHRHDAPLPVPLHVLAGRDDDIPGDAVQGWSAEASEPCTLDWFDGGHFFIRQQEQVVLDVLARRLRPQGQGETSRADRALA